MADKLKAIQTAHDQMDKLQRKHAKLGANDTEPDMVYHNAVRDAFGGKPFKPLSADGWDLFIRKEGAEDAAKQLNLQTKKICDLILKLKVAEMDPVREWARGVFWRAQF